MSNQATTTADGSAGERPSTALYVGGAVLLTVALAGALALSMHDVSSAFALPGCGPTAGCAELANAKVLGFKVSRVPGLGWPVAFVGLAYFCAMLVAWLGSRRHVPGWFRVTAALGALGSLGLLGLMFFLGKFCVYCVAVHAANLVFVASLLVGVGLFGRAAAASPAASSVRRNTWPTVVFAVIVFALVSGSLGYTKGVMTEIADARAQKQRDETTRRIIENAKVNQSENTAAVSDDGPGDADHETVSKSDDSRPPAVTPVDHNPAPASDKPFTGRWRLGPEKASVRVVAFIDYQCELCHAVERLLMQMVKDNPQMSLSVKMFPYCTDCNPHADRNLHTNACWAARAAETAGLLGGNDAFWKMHEWLFMRAGLFISQEDLNKGIQHAGLDNQEFTTVLNQKPEILKWIHEDVDEAWALGITQTPMVFINGVEVQGLQNPRQLKEEIDKVIAADLPPKTAAADHPPAAVDKFLSIWRDQPVKQVPVVAGDHSRGSDKPDVDVVVWGDYREEGVAKVNDAMKELMASRPWVRYTFRQLPLNPQCNDYLPPNARNNEQACRAARVAEAAGIVGGDEGFWKMHDWLLDNRDIPLGDLVVRVAAKRLGLDDERIVQLAGDPQTEKAVRDDCAAAGALGPLRMPLIFVNGRLTQTWQAAGQNILARIVDEARKR